MMTKALVKLSTMLLTGAFVPDCAVKEDHWLAYNEFIRSRTTYTKGDRSFFVPVIALKSRAGTSRIRVNSPDLMFSWDVTEDQIVFSDHLYHLALEGIIYSDLLKEFNRHKNIYFTPLDKPSESAYIS